MQGRRRYYGSVRLPRPHQWRDVGEKYYPPDTPKRQASMRASNPVLLWSDRTVIGSEQMAEGNELPTTSWSREPLPEWCCSDYSGRMLVNLTGRLQDQVLRSPGSRAISSANHRSARQHSWPPRRTVNSRARARGSPARDDRGSLRQEDARRVVPRFDRRA